ncbi:hypothetical protein DH2020_008399 [Rehmannia glutinosa]|uniref:Uncharacterized protein n=1 Tax=Rehmannia glutinosa TaxID=99300 RepID=A0ABR0U1R1_REHGL
MIAAILRPNLTRSRFKNSSSLCNSNGAFPLFLLNFSTSGAKQTVTHPTVSEFLLHKHQFSPEAASQVASVLTRIKNPEKSDSILSFLKQSGFPKTLIEKIVKSRPELLSANLEKTIKPRIKIFQDLGFSANDIVKVISGNPWFLRTSLINLAPNVEFLKNCGVAMEQIIWAMYYFQRFMLSNPERMKKFVEKADEMGVSRSSKMFIHAVRVISSMNENTWELKLRILRDLGFSEDDMAEAFRNAPLVFGVSEEKIKEVKELLLATGKYNMSCIVNNPVSFMYSVEKRYKPRLRVLEMLESRNVIESWPGVGTLCRMSDKKFYEKFVGPYLDEVGDLYMAKCA